MLERGTVALAALDATDVRRIEQLMRKYKDLPMYLADACLVRLAEREGIEAVFTTDRRDFSLYRPQGTGRFKILP